MVDGQRRKKVSSQKQQQTKLCCRKDLSMVTKSSIHVCQSSVCRGRGSEVVLVEIEELAKLVNNNQDNDDNNTQHKLSVHPTGCLGYCFRGEKISLKIPPEFLFTMNH